MEECQFALSHCWCQWPGRGDCIPRYPTELFASTSSYYLFSFFCTVHKHREHYKRSCCWTWKTSTVFQIFAAAVRLKGWEEVDVAYAQQQYKTSAYCNSSEWVSICEQLAHICELSIYQEGYGTEQTLTCPLLLFLMMCSLHGLIIPSGKGKKQNLKMVLARNSVWSQKCGVSCCKLLLWRKRW